MKKTQAQKIAVSQWLQIVTDRYLPNMNAETYIENRYLKVQEAIQLLNRLFGPNTWRMEVNRQYQLRKEDNNVALFRFSRKNMYSLRLELSLRFAS